MREVQFEPSSHDDRFWDSSDDPSRLHRRPVSFSGRMFNVGWKGWTRLVIVCVIVGAIFQAGGFNPFAPGFTVGVGAGQLLDGIIKIATWSAQLAAMPLLLGAILVLPLWLMWRALVTLVNRDRPPGPDDRILPKDRKKTPRHL
ncbi:MAG: hypothetical protein ABMA14_20105 [Hyphomonadaceae bacterium]